MLFLINVINVVSRNFWKIVEINITLMFGPPPISPLFQGDCSGNPYPNPYFPKPSAKWTPQAPFWYRIVPGDPCAAGPNWPVGNPDDFKWDTPPYPVTGETLLEVFEIDRPERYLPGEIYRNKPVKQPIVDLSKTADCQKEWVPKDPGFYRDFQPTREILNPPLLLDGVLQRKAETYNSYLIPQERIVEETCEGVEDTETKNKKRPNFLEALKYADTRPENFKCDTDNKVCFKEACRIPDNAVKVTPGILRKMWRPKSENPVKSEENHKSSRDECHCPVFLKD